MKIDQELFLQSIKSDGFFIATNVIEKAFVEKIKKQLASAIENEKNTYGGGDYKDYAMVMLCSMYGEEFLRLFDIENLIKPFEWVLGDGCIVYAYTSSSMPPGSSNYSFRIHVDCPRLIPGYITNMGATILLDDFTFENGATYYLPRSQTMKEAPTKEEFEKNAKRVIAPAGSVFYFNARLWHSGGYNFTNNWRHALTINMCHPYMKQRIDIPRAMRDVSIEGVSDKVLQKLGYFSQPPATVADYYKPLSERSYKQKTE